MWSALLYGNLRTQCESRPYGEIGIGGKKQCAGKTILLVTGKIKSCFLRYTNSTDDVFVAIEEKRSSTINLTPFVEIKMKTVTT